MNITFRQLRLFLALAETGSVSGAARALHVTQPTASMQLKDMSESVGLPLYEVVAKKVYLTDIGQELAKTARAIAQSWDAFEQEADGVRGLTRGQLRVAVVSTAQYFMPRLLGSFCARHPAIDVSLEVLNRDGVVQRLRENMDDLYIMSMPPADMDLSDDIFMTNPIVVVAPADDALVSRSSVPLDALRSHRFILRERGSGTRMVADQHFRSHRFRPDIRLELGSNEAIKEAVAGGLGIAVLSRHVLHGLDGEHGVSVIDVEGFPVLSNWHIVHPGGKKLSPLARAFKAHLLAT
ncbi:LysR family transcriptional regulator [Methyloversatilis sp.]|uniref:LysR family transcriptional regulator n=1 Tax=Methyloversatilis sp. TaxID=2569862 RepID=UPI0027362A15|nr:LysR family transcriptional regulator [Methyloversatilis sp.]MDP2870899.1 LysR family transcriptional regulator [Methyloversatilis sp.]MDP3289156.1 LysR family transcriptional regulator [Methyloversatilis sp.]MDP3454123.1 LysR family transcriptional regulator [Methyloversatilis sp.]MDP3578289.1 LysR family transcriptional regulator [Methyloversatilis sp.]